MSDEHLFKGMLVYSEDHIAGFRGEAFFLSNYSPAEVVLDGVVYPTTENAFQAAKTLDKTAREAFQTCSPAKSKELGRIVQLRSDWADIRIELMEYLLLQKFSNPILSAKLLATGNAYLEERNYWGDKTWGTDLHGFGDNLLGKMIMKIRDNLIKFGEAEPYRVK